MATGGSTNETMHLVAIARAAGIRIDWNDFAELTDITPLLVRIYPNEFGDINFFQWFSGMALLVKGLLEGELIHEDVQTVAGKGFERYTRAPVLKDDKTIWQEGRRSHNHSNGE